MSVLELEPVLRGRRGRGITAVVQLRGAAACASLAHLLHGIMTALLAVYLAVHHHLGHHLADLAVLHALRTRGVLGGLDAAAWHA